MAESWYHEIAPSEPITQGDIIFDCPILTWRYPPPDSSGLQSEDDLKKLIEAEIADIVVMTQACDLEQRHVERVIACPHLSLEEYHASFNELKSRAGQTPTSKAWRSQCDDIRNGYVWNLAMLNAWNDAEHPIAHRIVDFREVYTLPRAVLESLLMQRGRPRLSLLPPYREHHSQAFARFFMRVGLPTAVTTAW